MNEMLVRSRALRVAGFGLTLMAGATLSACGGDNNNDGGGGGGGGGSVGTADLTAAGAKAQVGTFGQMIQALGALDSLNNTAPVAAAPRNKPLGKRSTVRSKASEACPDGGTIESTGPTSKNVGSPFTDMSMSVSGTQTTNCKYSDSYSSDGSDVTIDLVSNGATEGGGVEDNNTWVEYARVGSDSAPYSFDYDIDSSGNAQGVSYSSKVKLGIGIDYRDDYKENSDGAEDRFVLSMDGDYDATASSNGQGGSTSGNFTYYIGTHDTPFTAVEDNAGTVISGEYGFKLDGVQGQTCPSGAVTVETVDPLIDSTESTASPFSAGTLKFSSGNSSAQISFNNDGTVTVEGSDGQSQTFDYAEALAASAPCAGYGLAGVYLAAGLAAR